MPSHKRQMMQPWPLCLVSFSRSRDRSILPSHYSRVPRLSKSGSSARSTVPQDCASNTTLLTNTSPFNSQQALISDKKKLSIHDENHELASSHYYANNLRHETDLRHSVPIYDPLSKDEDLTDYKQLEPLIFPQDSVEIGEANALMELQKHGDEGADDNVQSTTHGRVKKRSQFSIYATQVLAALSVSFGSMVVGFASGYTSPTEESMLNSTVTSFVVTKDTFSWVGASMPLAALFGGIAGGPGIEYLGRRNTILATAFPFIGSWLLIAMATEVWMVLAGRVLCGFCMGIATLSLPVYLGETLQPEIRGILGLLPTAFGNTGILICFTAGMFLNWYELAYLGACIPIPFLLLMFFIPETPRWYVSKGKTKKARKSLQWLRGKTADISDELSAIEKTHVESERDSSQNIVRELLKSNHVKPLLISLGLMFFQQMSGINAVIFYATGIFKDAGSSIDKGICTIIVGIVNFIATFVATTVIDRLGRKMLLYISSVSMIITLFCLGIFFYLKEQHYQGLSTISWLPLASLVIYVIGFSLGFGPIPWLMMGEILPAKIRGPAASIATGFNWSCTFLVTKTFPIFNEKVGSSTTFWIFNGICILGLIFVVLCVPETRGRSLEEIEKRLTGPVRRMSAVANMKPMPTAC